MKESYERTARQIIRFQAEDVVITSDKREPDELSEIIK